MKSELFPSKSFWFEAREKEGTSAVTGFLRTPDCEAHEVTPGLPRGEDVSLVLSAEPAFWPQELERLHWFTATSLFPSFWSSQSVVCSKRPQGKQRPMNLPNREVVLSQDRHCDTHFVLKRVPCASVEHSCGLCRCLQRFPEHRALSLCVGDPVQGCLQPLALDEDQPWWGLSGQPSSQFPLRTARRKEGNISWTRDGKRKKKAI